jgi:hypothetical protein
MPTQTQVHSLQLETQGCATMADAPMMPPHISQTVTPKMSHAHRVDKLQAARPGDQCPFAKLHILTGEKTDRRESTELHEIIPRYRHIAGRKMVGGLIRASGSHISELQQVVGNLNELQGVGTEHRTTDQPAAMLQTTDSRGQPTRVRLTIRIDKGKVLASRLLHTQITRGTRPENRRAAHATSLAESRHDGLHLRICSGIHHNRFEGMSKLLLT